MEPITMAATFSTIVGLIANFRQERGASEALDHQKFMDWLEYHRHEEIKNLICNTTALRTEVDGLLRADHAAMMEKLDMISSTLATLLSRVPDFRGLAVAMVPKAELSEQAVFILRQFVNSDSSFFYYLRMSGSFSMQLEEGELMEIMELRLLDDDLDQLVALGLLTREDNGDSQLYRITRNAVQVIHAIDGKAQPT